MLTHEPSPLSQAIFSAMAGEMAHRYLDEMLMPSLSRTSVEPGAEPQDYLRSAQGCLRSILGHYAFCRRGKDRTELSHIALSALDRFQDGMTFQSLLEDTTGEEVWIAFAEICEQRNRRPMEQLNNGVIAGMVELAQEIYALDRKGSIAGWIVKGAEIHGRLEPQFLRIVDVRGVGPKLASMLLRDIVDIFKLESVIDPADRLYCVPIDKWSRMAAPLIIAEPNADEMPDWVLAGKICKYARRVGVSPLRFSMGLAFFGQRIANPMAPFHQQLQSVAEPKVFLK